MIYNRIPITIGEFQLITGPTVSFQYDVVQFLVFSGVTLPEYYTVDFCNEGDTRTIPIENTENGVRIPDELLLTGRRIKAYIVVTGTDAGASETRFEITLPVRSRPERSDIEPTPSERLEIDELVNALNDGVTRAEDAATDAEGQADRAETAADNAETAVTHYPKIEDGYWYVWLNGGWVNTGVKAEGVDGKGIVSVTGAKTSSSGLVDTYTLTVTYTDSTTDTITFTVTNGRDGVDGYSPTATVTKSGTTSTITITDKNGTTTATVTDGVDGVSPTVTVTDITGGHRVTITDKDHPTGQSFDVLNGEITQVDLDAAVTPLNQKINVIEADYYETIEEDHNIDIGIDMPNSGLLNANGSITVNANYHYSNKIPVRPGDSITIDAKDSNYNVVVHNTGANRLCCYSGETIDTTAGSNSPSKPIVIPDGIDSVVITLQSKYIEVVVHIYRENSSVQTAKIYNLLETEKKKVVVKVTPEIVTGKFVNKSGTVSTNASYYYFNLYVNPGDYIGRLLTRYNGGSSIVPKDMRYVCAYVDGVADSSLGAESVADYTVPDTVTKIAISVEATYPLDGYVCIYRDANVNEVKDAASVNSALFASYPQKVTGDLAVSSSLTLTANSVKKNKEIVFSGKITTFNKITIGQGANDLNSESIEIDNTNIVIKYGTSSTAQIPHGLTISDYITVAICVDDNHKGHFNILTGSGKFTYDHASTYVGCMSNIYATTDASTALMDCTLSFVCNDIREPIWIFGDSYVSYYDERWPYYISKMGFNRYLLNGYSGETAQYAIKDLDNLLIYGTPKYLVWCLGMNNADTTSEVANSWKICLDQVIAMCNERNIKLILATIPNTPDRNHSFKNDIVVNSGYPYINFADAVGAFDDSTWYTGMLSSDNTHPTVTGGIALASQVLKDFPLICIV